MAKLTICVPVRDELYANNTVDDIFKKATGDIEVILVLDDCWNLPLPADRPNLTIIHNGERRGIRGAINAAAEIGKGDYLMKVDSHCLFAQGFDEALTKDCDVDWLVTARRYWVEPYAWKKKDKKSIRYEYLQYPYNIVGGREAGLHAKYWWDSRDLERDAFQIDENMSFQGSMWMMPMKYFRDLIYPMDYQNYGNFIGEPEELGLKVWLSGGKVMLNKNTWYAHLFKGKWYRAEFLQQTGRPYVRTSDEDMRKGEAYSTDFWMNNRWEKRVHDIEWLIDKFWPVPTWPEDWKTR